ncbi:MAG: XdhC family protein [Syntrophotaleaceae bacterium]
MENLYAKMAELIEKNESFAVATIFDKTGSAPRTEGAKMVVRADGTIFGTIGGGRLEAGTIELAKSVIAEEKSVIKKFDLTGADAACSDMICGGAGEILVDFIDAGDQDNLLICREAAGIVDRSDKGWLVTVLGKESETSGIPRRQCLVKADRTLVGQIDCSPYLLEKLVTGPAKITLHSEAFDERRFLVEPLRQGGTVFIFGAGHVSQKIAPLSASVGFRTLVLDDRSDFANRDRFPSPIQVRVIEDFRKLPDLGIDGDSYLVIVTRGHLFDKDVLEQVLRSGAAYIGMIGSRSKRDLVYEEIISHGFSREELARVHSPIGTNIGAETPEELGVSIVGELIQVRAARNAGKTEKPREASGCRIQTL